MGWLSRKLNGTEKCENGCGAETGKGIDGRYIDSKCRRQYGAGDYQKNQLNPKAKGMGGGKPQRRNKHTGL